MWGKGVTEFLQEMLPCCGNKTQVPKDLFQPGPPWMETNAKKADDLLYKSYKHSQVDGSVDKVLVVQSWRPSVQILCKTSCVQVPRTYVKPAVVVWMYNPSMPMMQFRGWHKWVLEAGLSQKRQKVKTDTQGCLLISTHMPWPTLTHEHSHTQTHTRTHKNKTLKRKLPAMMLLS